MSPDTLKTTDTPGINPATDKPLIKNEIIFHMQQGVKLSDVYMDAHQVMNELSISRRTLQNWRSRGKISFTDVFGKIYYFRQEIAGKLNEGKKCHKS